MTSEREAESSTPNHMAMRRMHQEHRFWHQAKQGSNLASCLLRLCLSLLSEDSTRHTFQLWAQARKKQLETMKMNHLSLTPEPCRSAGGGQGWNKNNSPGRNCATGTVRKLLACFRGSRMDVPFLQKKADGRLQNSHHPSLERQ